MVYSKQDDRDDLIIFNQIHFLFINITILQFIASSKINTINVISVIHERCSRKKKHTGNASCLCVHLVCVFVCVCACVCVQLTLELARQHVGALALAPPPSMLSEHQLSLWKHGARRRGHVCDPALHTPHTPTLTFSVAAQYNPWVSAQMCLTCLRFYPRECQWWQLVPTQTHACTHGRMHKHTHTLYSSRN